MYLFWDQQDEILADGTTVLGCEVLDADSAYRGRTCPSLNLTAGFFGWMFANLISTPYQYWTLVSFYDGV